MEASRVEREAGDARGRQPRTRPRAKVAAIAAAFLGLLGYAATVGLVPGCRAGLPCDTIGMLVVHVPRDACEGTVTGAGACPGEFSQYSEICTEWEGALYSPDGAVCTVTLTMPDGSTRSKQVVVKASDDGCVRYEEVTFE